MSASLLVCMVGCFSVFIYLALFKSIECLAVNRCACISLRPSDYPWVCLFNVYSQSAFCLCRWHCIYVRLLFLSSWRSSASRHSSNESSSSSAANVMMMLVMWAQKNKKWKHISLCAQARKHPFSPTRKITMMCTNRFAFFATVPTDGYVQYMSVLIYNMSNVIPGNPCTHSTYVLSSLPSAVPTMRLSQDSSRLPFCLFFVALPVLVVLGYFSPSGPPWHSPSRFVM